ncbi:uncharacterized protein I303_105741 [Kwoniella dejecticola CBS 10117]|uniref:Uncharacterized protein n=1 Tax=Kwoniella dejecticola CBS 10117 TaxID=1296121 RepID=A0A1A6A098_9TREE|nr:uncharacterized protein I303_05763 [Kwoniella dejecticola CBS 10117]OBR83484.1 hypothetical protein I303_05763 [Kwoniella dejecticola CBS 10117]
MTYPNSSTSSLSDPSEVHLLYVLLDSNLPTGGFVSSSGLESFAKHGFLSTIPPFYDTEAASDLSDEKRSNHVSTSKRSISEGVVDFARAEVENYACTTGGFVSDSWMIVNDALPSASTSSWQTAESGGGGGGGGRQNSQPEDEDDLVSRIVNDVIALDRYNEATLLSHVARRSSKAQGVAMLTLYTRGLSEPELSGLNEDGDNDHGSSEGGDDLYRDRMRKRREMAKRIVDGYKRSIRKGDSPGHLAVCWGVITACLGLSLDRSIHLHLFLHARSLLSSAVRLNLIGPYASSQLLLHPFKRIIEDQTLKVISMNTSEHYNIKDRRHVHNNNDNNPNETAEDQFWTWADDAEGEGPYTTWPLGEILTARHDLQHSRIFNS